MRTGKTLLYTTQKRHWFTDDLKDIIAIKNTQKSYRCDGIDVVYIPLKSIPLERGDDGKMRPSKTWFKETLTYSANPEYTEVALHITERERNKFGISRSIGGSYLRDVDNTIEFWFAANRGQKAKNYIGKSEFWRRFLHESGHGSERFIYGNNIDLVHHADYVTHMLPALFSTFDWSAWSILKARLEALLKPPYSLPFKEWGLVTQAYGNIDPITYPKTWVHIGTDFKTPYGTEIKMPKDGKVTRVGYSRSLGNWCEVKIDDWYLVALHLMKKPEVRAYKRGETFATVGDTGFIKGVHSHLEGWTRPMDRSLLRKDTWQSLTFNIKTKIP